MGLILLIILIVLLVGGIPASRAYVGPNAWYGVGGVGFVLLVVLIILILSHTIVWW